MENQAKTATQIVYFRLSPRIAQPGWYYRLSADRNWSGPFHDRRSVDHAVSMERANL